MFRKGPLIPIVVLIVAALASSLFISACAQNNGTDVVRRDGECSDPRFKEAELAAYRALLQARTDAANRLTRQISNLEAARKKLLSKYNDDYQSDLNKCGDTSCTLAAKDKYDKSVAGGLRLFDQNIQLVQEQEQRANAAAQELYNAAVEKARQQFCGTPTPSITPTSTRTPTPTPTITATPYILMPPTPS